MQCSEHNDYQSQSPLQFCRHFAIFMLLVSLAGHLLAAETVPGTGKAATDGDVKTITVAALKFGTVNWELATIKRQGFDRDNGFQLQVMHMAGMSATRTALKSRAADVIVADWMWVTRQRDMGDQLQFIPYSSSIGKVMLARGSNVQTLADLQGKTIGIAGGPVSKGWLLLQALGLQQGLDLKSTTKQQFGAPPLLNAALERGQLDAVITFWHYAARLEGKGYPVLHDLKEISARLGMSGDLPMLGYVFHQDWAEKNPELVAGLLRASTRAKAYLGSSDSAWQALKPSMKADSEAVFERLKRGFLDGTPATASDTASATDPAAMPATTAQTTTAALSTSAPTSAADLQQAQRMFAVLADVGGEKLVGKSRRLDPETFWQQQ